MPTTRTRRLLAAGLLPLVVATGCRGVLTDDQLLALRTCESGGNYSAVSKSGTYRGAYQFSRRTWLTVGGVGDPAAAAPAEQDYRARILYVQAGRAPWPVCGRRIR